MTLVHHGYHVGIASIGALFLVWSSNLWSIAQDVRFREILESNKLNSASEESDGFQEPALSSNYLEIDRISIFDSKSSRGLTPIPKQDHRRLSTSEGLWNDQQNFYSGESMILLGGGLIVGGALANSNIDQQIDKHFQSSVRRATSDEWFNSFHASKELGNGLYTLPIFATAWGTSTLFPDSQYADAAGRWGEMSIRGFLVGAPPLILLQRVTGGSRPDEIVDGSKWHPFQDNNGISGHAFMGSLPFITAAKMTKNRGYKALFYAGSTIAPLSRVNDGAHYASQVALGWWMAFLAASAVRATEDPNSRWRLLPYTTFDGTGVSLEYRF